MNETTKLLWVTITDKRHRFMRKKRELWTEIKFEHVDSKWTVTNHWVDPDKLESAPNNCYDEIEVGCSYLILSVQLPDVVDEYDGITKNRWVWRKALKIEPQHIRKLYKFWKKSGDISETQAYWDYLRKPDMVGLVKWNIDW